MLTGGLTWRTDSPRFTGPNLSRGEGRIDVSHGCMNARFNNHSCFQPNVTSTSPSSWPRLPSSPRASSLPEPSPSPSSPLPCRRWLFAGAPPDRRRYNSGQKCRPKKGIYNGACELYFENKLALTALACRQRHTYVCNHTLNILNSGRKKDERRPICCGFVVCGETGDSVRLLVGLLLRGRAEKQIDRSQDKDQLVKTKTDFGARRSRAETTKKKAAVKKKVQKRPIAQLPPTDPPQDRLSLTPGTLEVQHALILSSLAGKDVCTWGGLRLRGHYHCRCCTAVTTHA